MKAVVVLHLSIALWGSEKRDDHSSFECWLIEFEHTQTLYQEDNVARFDRYRKSRVRRIGFV